jgi:hypothetical protein
MNPGERPRFYILSRREPIEVVDPLEWCEWFWGHAEDRLVGHDVVYGVEVYTCFIGIDCSYWAEPLQLFETIVIKAGKPMQGMSERYEDWKAAELGHQRMVNRIGSLSDVSR